VALALRFTQTVKRILVVDDDPHVREILIQRLRGRRYQAEGAGNGAEAMAKLDRDAYDVVLLDLILPGMSGSQVARELDRRVGGPPYIIISGVGGPWHRHNPGQKPIAIVEKPIDFEKLVTVINGCG
jgi:two-component system OmpR family response regulator